MQFQDCVLVSLPDYETFIYSSVPSCLQLSKHYLGGSQIWVIYILAYVPYNIFEYFLKILLVICLLLTREIVLVIIFVFLYSVLVSDKRKSLDQTLGNTRLLIHGIRVRLPPL